MKTRIGIFLDLCEAGKIERALSEIEQLQPWQVSSRWDEFISYCPDRLIPPLERRSGNVLNIEIGQPLPRCRQMTPKHWNQSDYRGARWLYSGGSQLVFGICCFSECPRANNDQS